MDPVVSNKVQEIVAEALYLDRDEVEAGSNLVKDLGAESIDFLDIVFRLESEFNITVPRNELIERARDGLPEEEFVIDGVIQPKGLEAIRKSLPAADERYIRDGMTMRDVPSVFTVSTFTHIVEEQLAKKNAGGTEASVAKAEPAVAATVQ